jgi:hypothetical protein
VKNNQLACRPVARALVSVIICVLAAAPTFALAQGSVADAGAVVPPVVYQSVFADGPKGVETTSTDWKKANAEVGQFKRGHMDILKWDDAHKPAKPAVPETMAPPAPAMHKH